MPTPPPACMPFCQAPSRRPHRQFEASPLQIVCCFVVPASRFFPGPCQAGCVPSCTPSLTRSPQSQSAVWPSSSRARPSTAHSPHARTLRFHSRILAPAGGIKWEMPERLRRKSQRSVACLIPRFAALRPAPAAQVAPAFGEYAFALLRPASGGGPEGSKTRNQAGNRTL